MTSAHLRGRTVTAATEAGSSGRGSSAPHDDRAALVARAARTVVAGAAGVGLYATFEPVGLWWLGLPALAALFLALRGATAAGGFGLGFVAGLGMMLPLLRWTGEFVGPIGSVPLATVQALLVAVTGTAIAVVSRLTAAPLWGSLVWVAGETLRSLVPFGGFPWAKLAFGQVDGVFLPLVIVAGTPIVAFAVALCGFSAGELVHALWTSRSPFLTPGRRLRSVAVFSLLGGLAAPVLAGLAARGLIDTGPEAGEVTVAAVQGDVPRPGLDFNAERRAVLDNHARVTRELAADVASGQLPQPDLVIWPENSSDIDPYANQDAYERIQAAAEAVGVPILVGAVVGGSGPAPSNNVVVWDPVTGPGQDYTKRRLQPFGETMPLREFFRFFSDDVDRAGRFVPGDDPTVLDVGDARVAVTLCYEVIFDGVVRDSIRNGANLLAVPSNNATFGFTDMTYQQLAIDRVRAVEHGRAVVVATTSGVSAIIQPDGRVVSRTGMFVPGTLVESVPLRTSLTLADRVGSVPEWVMVLAAVGALTAAIAQRRRSAGPNLKGRSSIRRATPV